jgi:hypothetical protein
MSKLIDRNKLLENSKSAILAGIDWLKCILTCPCRYTKKLSEIGGFLLGFSAVIALCKTDGLLDEILKIGKGVEQLEKSNGHLRNLAQQHREGIKELKDIVKVLQGQLINNEARKISENAQKLTPENRIKILKDISPSTSSTLKEGQIYLPKSALEEAKELFKRNEPILQEEYLRNKLEIWNKKS